ncbi:hypothetical protein G6F40_013516 [Rhizopus arrhizus]|nr:hypothetical protein G6F40_013516 [Rhizopus arrhizus]
MGQPRPGQGAADEGGDRQAQALAGYLRAAGNALHDRHLVGHGGVEHLHEQVGLGREVPVDQPGGHPRLGRHGGYRGVAPAACGDQLAGGQQDPFTGPGQAFFHQCRAFVGHVLILVSIFEFVFTSFPNPVTLGSIARAGDGPAGRRPLPRRVRPFPAVPPWSHRNARAIPELRSWRRYRPAAPERGPFCRRRGRAAGRRGRCNQPVPVGTMAEAGRTGPAGPDRGRRIRRHRHGLPGPRGGDGRNLARLWRHRPVLRRALQPVREPDQPQRHGGPEGQVPAQADFGRTP